MRLSRLATCIALIACLIGAYPALTHQRRFSFEQVFTSLRSTTVFKVGQSIDPIALALSLTGAAIAIGLCFAAIGRTRR